MLVALKGVVLSLGSCEETFSTVAKVRTRSREYAFLFHGDEKFLNKNAEVAARLSRHHTLTCFLEEGTLHKPVPQNTLNPKLQQTEDRISFRDPWNEALLSYVSEKEPPSP